VDVTGHPKTDALQQLERSIDPQLEAFAAGRKLVCWNPHFDVRPDGSAYGTGYSTFSRWYNFLLEEFARRPDMAFLIRPHPLLFASLVQRRIFTPEQVSAFRGRCAAAGNIQIDTRPSYLPAFASSAAMLSDFSTFVLEYPATGKPLLYLSNPYSAEVEGDLSVGDYCPPCESEAGIVAFLDQVKAGHDPEAAARTAAFQARLSMPPGGVGPAIKRAIESRLRLEQALAAGASRTAASAEQLEPSLTQ
jgi:hypothetical protein